MRSFDSFLRRFFFAYQRSKSAPPSSGLLFAKRNMSSSTAAVLYALTVTTSPVSPGPEDATKKSHHLQAGFTNPWE